MYPAFDWSICSGPSWISARVRPNQRKDLNGPFGSPVFACAGKTDLHLISSSRRPRLETVDRVTSSFAPHVAQFLCSSQGPFLRPARRTSSGSDICIVGPGKLEGASLGQHRPGDAGKLVGERDRQHVGMQPPPRGFDPGFESVTLPVL